MEIHQCKIMLIAIVVQFAGQSDECITGIDRISPALILISADAVKYHGQFMEIVAVTVAESLLIFYQIYCSR